MKLGDTYMEVGTGALTRVLHRLTELETDGKEPLLILRAFVNGSWTLASVMGDTELIRLSAAHLERTLIPRLDKRDHFQAEISYGGYLP